MPVKNVLPSSEVAEILNLATQGLAKAAIGSVVRVAPSTVYKVIKEFPLWEYVWEKTNVHKTNQTYRN